MIGRRRSRAVELELRLRTLETRATMAERRLLALERDSIGQARVEAPRRRRTLTELRDAAYRGQLGGVPPSSSATAGEPVAVTEPETIGGALVYVKPGAATEAEA